MKTLILFKVILILPVIIFADWIFLIVLGCLSGLCGFGNNFYCGVYCLIGKGILLVSAVSFIIYLLFPILNKIIKHNIHAETH